jgi:hypothetical protein
MRTIAIAIAMPPPAWLRVCEVWLQLAQTVFIQTLG